MNPELVLPTERGWSRVALLEGRWQNEFGGDRLAWDEAWLWGGLGYATFENSVQLPSSGICVWVLKRVWLEPSLRRKGLLSDVWPLWVDRYGEFEVAAPNDAMTAFLADRARKRALGEPIVIHRVAGTRAAQHQKDLVLADGAFPILGPSQERGTVASMADNISNCPVCGDEIYENLVHLSPVGPSLSYYGDDPDHVAVTRELAQCRSCGVALERLHGRDDQPWTVREDV